MILVLLLVGSLPLSPKIHLAFVLWVPAMFCTSGSPIRRWKEEGKESVYLFFNFYSVRLPWDMCQKLTALADGPFCLHRLVLAPSRVPFIYPAFENSPFTKLTSNYPIAWASVSC